MMSAILLALEGIRRDFFLKVVGKMLDHEIYFILEYAEVLYYTVIYRAVMEELDLLEIKLTKIKIPLDKNILTQYINTVNEKNSMYS